MKYEQGYYQYQGVGLGVSDFGYPEFPAYMIEEEIDDHEFGYHPFPAYCIQDTLHR